MKVAVLGAGAWGSALAKIISENGHAVTLWGHRADHLQRLSERRINELLPGVSLPPEIQFEPDLATAVSDVECVVVAVPSKAFRDTAKNLAGYRGIVASATKGIEFDSGLTMCGVAREVIPGAALVALSGPTFALEAAASVPTAIVAASSDASAAQTVQQAFHRPWFRVYTNSDPLGVELGGALKNVVAIAAGTGDGLGFGDNSKAALITRGIVEIRRLGVAVGARAETFSGLSGLGDLTATCYSRLSRNRAFGERVGRGEKLEGILAGASLPEGYPTSRAAYQLARKIGVETPIIDEVYAMLYERKDPRRAVADLTKRESRAENW
ncbi:MAG TPA: NAD(P)H-dependent glycerol-3-phosphate dehydrogenase [Verrucomicrobiae bacterium]|nr:NAD(P)H-dependent glycerol-3-phosphate dehydrogenase [Verrucomicrobiae bacterium]